MDEIFFTSKEVAQMLRMSLRSIHLWLAEGRIRAVKLGWVWRIPKSSFEEFLQKYEYNPANRGKKGLAVYKQKKGK